MTMNISAEQATYDALAAQVEDALDRAQTKYDHLAGFYRDVFVPAKKKLMYTSYQGAATTMQDHLLDTLRDLYDKHQPLPHKATPGDLQVGTVLVQSWGYEHTNVDFFVVTKVTTKTVTVLPMTRVKEYTGDMTGTSKPGRIKWEEKTMRRSWRTYGDGYVNVNGENSYQSMSPWTGRAERWSSYA